MAFPFGIWGMGDKAGARMAFKDAWPAARAKYGDQVEVSLGHHKASRAAAVLDAVRTGMIEQRAARLLLPQLTDAEFAGMQRSLPSQTGLSPPTHRVNSSERAGSWCIAPGCSFHINCTKADRLKMSLSPAEQTSTPCFTKATSGCGFFLVRLKVR